MKNNLSGNKKLILFLCVCLGYFCFACDNRNSKTKESDNDLPLITENSSSLPIEIPDLEKEEEIIDYRWINEYVEPEAPEVLMNDSGYKTFVYYKNRNRPLKKVTYEELQGAKESDIIVKWSNELDTTLLPLNGDFMMESIHTEMLAPEFFKSNVLIDQFDIYPYLERGSFKNGLIDGEWVGKVCGGIGIPYQYHTFFTEGVLDSLHYSDCSPPHKGEIPEDMMLHNEYFFYFKNGLVHGDGKHVFRDFHVYSLDTFTIAFNYGELVSPPIQKDSRFEGFKEGFEDDYEDFSWDTYLKYKTVNNKKEGEWVTSGWYARKENGYSNLHNNKNIVISNYKNDLLHGEYIISNFYKDILPPPTDSIKTVFYKTEFKNGTGYYVSQDLHEEGPMFEGKKNGMWKYFVTSQYKNGKKELRSMGEYLNDEKHGVWQYFKLYRPTMELEEYRLYYKGHLLYVGKEEPRMYDFVTFNSSLTH